MADVKTDATKKIVLKLKNTDASSFSIRRAGVVRTISKQQILEDPVGAIYEHKLEYLFENSPEEITEVIRRVDEKKGLTKTAGYKTRSLRGVKSTSNDYDVL